MLGVILGLQFGGVGAFEKLLEEREIGLSKAVRSPQKIDARTLPRAVEPFVRLRLRLILTNGTFCAFGLKCRT